MTEPDAGPGWAGGARVELDEPSTASVQEPARLLASESVAPNADLGPATRARLIAARTLARTAGRAEGFAGRAAQGGSAARRAAPLVGQAARRLDALAVYLQARETEEIVDDVEAAIRRHPLRALGVAFLAGYLARRIL